MDEDVLGSDVEVLLGGELPAVLLLLAVPGHRVLTQAHQLGGWLHILMMEKLMKRMG